MFPQTPDPKELGRYLALGQVGLEMVAPIIVGWVLDHYLGWSPWGLVGGAVLGLCGGLAHLVHLTNQEDRASSPKTSKTTRTSSEKTPGPGQESR
jgi:F0F1-type ATP synthase assembly protein I